MSLLWLWQNNYTGGCFNKPNIQLLKFLIQNLPLERQVVQGANSIYQLQTPTCHNVLCAYLIVVSLSETDRYLVGFLIL